MKDGDEMMGLKDIAGHLFHIGVALNMDQIDGHPPAAADLVRTHFNSIVAENCMKAMYLQPREGQFDFSAADRFIAFGESNGLHIVGHTLVWHGQAPKWFFVGADGNPPSREVMIERLRKHITTVVSRYKGRVKGWDVVNEAINDDGTWRESPLFKIIGPEFIPLAFAFAHEADPGAELYYNDYSTHLPGRRDAIVRLVNDLKARGLRIDAIGMQTHLQLVKPSIAEVEKSIEVLAGTGVKLMVTELDVSALPSPWEVGADVSAQFQYSEALDPYTGRLPPDAEAAHAQRYASLFRLFIKHAEHISRVTFWGLSDRESWLNDFPITGRTDYPLMFDRNYQPKSALSAIMKEFEHEQE